MSIRELIASLLCETNIDEEVTASHILKAYGLPDRKVGEWIVIMDEPTITFDECKCSECGVVEYFNKGWKKFNYCPNCGSLMKGEDDAEVR